MTAAPIPLYVVCRFDDLRNHRANGFNLVRVDDRGQEVAFPIVVVRWGREVFGYVNNCPHNNVRLDMERDQFMDPDGTKLMCGKHGATFDLGTGDCLDGPCRGQRLEPVELIVDDGDLCVVGVELAELGDPADETSDDLAE